MAMSKFSGGLAVSLVALLLALTFFWQPLKTPDTAFKGPPGGEFTLQSLAGPVSLKDLRGKVVLLYFGYTYCPDICPTSLAATAAGMKMLRAEELDKVAVLFVSVDPARDTLPRLQEYAAFFHPKVLGTTASPEVLAEVAARYGVFYAFQKVDTAGGGYVVDHSAETYVLNPAGELVGKIPHAAAPEQVLATIRRYLH